MFGGGWPVPSAFLISLLVSWRLARAYSFAISASAAGIFPSCLLTRRQRLAKQAPSVALAHRSATIYRSIASLPADPRQRLARLACLAFFMLPASMCVLPSTWFKAQAMSRVSVALRV